MDERAGNVIEAHGSAGTPVGRRIGDRLHREHAGPGIIGEGNAEAFAIGWGDERELRPAGRAQRGIAHRLAAGRAKRRQRHVEPDAHACAQPRAKPREARRLLCCYCPRHEDTLLPPPRVVMAREQRMSQLSVVFDRMLLAHAPPPRRGARAGDVPDRAGRGRHGGTACAGAAPVRARSRYRHADRRGAARAGEPCRRDRRGRRRPRASRTLSRLEGRGRRGGAAVRRWLARSRGVGDRAAVRQRSAGHAAAGAPGIQARRTVAGGAHRRRDPHRVARGICRSRNRNRGRGVAAHRALC